MRDYQSACFEYAHGIIGNQKNSIFSLWGPLYAIPLHQSHLQLSWRLLDNNIKKQTKTTIELKHAIRVT